MDFILFNVIGISLKYMYHGQTYSQPENIFPTSTTQTSIPTSPSPSIPPGFHTPLPSSPSHTSSNSPSSSIPPNFHTPTPSPSPYPHATPPLPTPSIPTPPTSSPIPPPPRASTRIKHVRIKQVNNGIFD